MTRMNGTDRRALARIKRAIEALSDDFLFQGLHPDPPNLSLTRNQIEKMSQIAPMGLGRKTVVDTTLRKTLEINPNDLPTDSEVVAWDGVNDIMDTVGATIGRKLVAKLDKILVYRPGDFFKTHRDSKKTPLHLMTLSVVVCNNNIVDAQNSNSSSSNATSASVAFRNQETWDDTRAGAYACWYNTEEHEVMPVVGGYRIVLSYIVEVIDAIPKTIVEQGTQHGETSIFPNIPNEIRDYVVVEFLGYQDLWAFSRCSKSMYKLYGDSSELFRALLFESKDHLFEMMLPTTTRFRRRPGVTSIGFFLSHEYSFDGTHSINPLALRGRDAILHDTFFKVFSACCKAMTTQALLKTEVSEEHSDGHVAYVDALQCVTDMDRFGERRFTTDDDLDAEQDDGSDSSTCVWVPPDLLHLLPKGKLRLDPHEFVSSNIEDDGPYEKFFWPFFRTLFVVSTTDQDRILTTCPVVGSEEECWGNAAMFDKYWYQQAAITFQIKKDPPSTSKVVDYDDSGFTVLVDLERNYTSEEELE